MVKHGYITQEEADIANAVDVTSLLAGNKDDDSYQGYIDTVVAEVKDKTGLDPALVSMEIYTTMDASIQNGINKVLAGDGYSWKDDKVQAGITIALTLTKYYLDKIGAGVCRVHGGGFAGVIAAFLPKEYTEGFVAYLDRVMRPGNAYVIHVRPQGAVKVEF